MNILPAWSYGSVNVKGAGFIDCGQSTLMSFDGNSPYTIGVWFILNKTSGRQFIAARGDIDIGLEWAIYVEDGRLKTCRDDVAVALSTEEVIKPNTWHHAAVSYDESNNQLTLYLDNEAVATKVFESRPAVKDGHVLLGAVSDNGKQTGFLDGLVGTVQIHASCRYIFEIIQDATNAPGRSGTPVAYYNFAAIPAKEQSGNQLPFDLRGDAEYIVCTPTLQLGGAGYVNAGHLSDLSLGGSKPYTLSGWIRPGDDVTTPQTILGKFDSDVAAEYRVYLADGKIHSYRNVDPWTVESPSVVEANTWLHFATTYNDQNATLTLYLNGDQVASQTFSSQPSFPELDLLIGAHLNKGAVAGQFKGYIQDIQLCNLCHTAEQIKEAMYSHPVDHPDVIADFDFDLIDNNVDSTGKHEVLMHGDAAEFMLKVPYAASQPPQTLFSFGDQAGVTVGLDPSSAELSILLNRWRQDTTAAIHRMAKPGADVKEIEQQITQTVDQALAGVNNGLLFQDLEIAREGGQVIIIHHTPAGPIEVFREAEQDVDSCTLWWISFVYMLTYGFFAAIGFVPSGSDIAKKVYELVMANPRAAAAIQSLAGLAIEVTAGFAIIALLYEEDLLWPIMKMGLTTLGYWALGRLLVKIIAIVYGVEVAEILAGFAVWATQITKHSFDYHSECPTRLAS